MTDLERFAAAVLAQWRAEDGKAGGPITVAALVDHVLPYRLARRLLGIDVSEDYEATVLRLIAEEGRLATVEPPGAAEMARTTMEAKLPDLGVLQLLRSASLTLTEDTLARLDGVLPLPAPKDEPRREPAAATFSDDDVIPLPVAQHAHPTSPAVAAPEEPAPEFLTTVAFTPPPEPRCWSCTETLPADRAVKFCPYCGADQRQPKCAACGEAVERRWRHCPECGTKLWAS